MKRSKYKITDTVRKKREQNRINRFDAKRVHIEFGFQKEYPDNIVH